MTRRDPYVNMLRTTIAVTAAGLGGADNIAALPHTAALGLPDAFARRVARNTQLILLEESNLAKVADPAAGSGAIEDLTGEALRRRLDAVSGDRKGGRRLGRARTGPDSARGRRRARRAASGRRAPQGRAHRHQRLSQSRTKKPARGARCRAGRAAEGSRRSRHRRAAAAHSPGRAVRGACATPPTACLAKTGARPKVFLANLGKLSDFTARATFAKNFYEAGGIEALEQ